MSKVTLPAEIKAMGFFKVGSKAELISYSPKPLAKHDIDMVVTYNGVCHSDIHQIDNDWGPTRFPLIPGHEVVGHVLAVGPAVQKFKVGDVVGLGALCQSCSSCNHCLEGHENVCSEKKFTYASNTVDEHGEYPHHGGFSSFLRTDSRLCYSIPDGMEEKHAGPLMCAGITVFEPLYHFFRGVDGKGKTIGVVGIGGLGHLAIQFASKMGANVVAFSRGTGKAELAKQLGADKLVDTTNEDDMAAAAGSIDQLIITISGGNFDINSYAKLMKPYGNIHMVGIPGEDLKIGTGPFILNRLSLSGSCVGGSEEMNAMLKFAAEHGVKPIIEVFPHSNANEAVQKIRDGTIRFRAVLKNDLT